MTLAPPPRLSPCTHSAAPDHPRVPRVNNIFTRVSGCLQSGHYVSPLWSGHPGESSDKADNDHISTFPKTKYRSFVLLVLFHDFLIRGRMCVRATRPWSDQVSNNLSRSREARGRNPCPCILYRL